MQKHRIPAKIGENQKIVVDIKQDYDLLEILSLKFTQTDIYTSMCADYGVVVGRISANNGFGIPNARVSIFIPVEDVDLEDPVISQLYPYKTITDKNEQNQRYNLLPSRQQHGGHAPTGTFPDQLDILSREEVMEVYEKYYKYTVKTNEAGDFMIWGVPLGTQTIHVDVDLSDMGCFSLRPDDFIIRGEGITSFENEYTFKSSEDIDSLPQIVSFNQTIDVYPFWGNTDICEIGITRTDFDLSDKGISVKPRAHLIGGSFTDTGKNSINKNCGVRRKTGRKCDLMTKAGNVESIRFTGQNDEEGKPILEYVTISDSIDEDGSFMVPLEMNMDFLYTNEFGENVYTNDKTKGIPTSACYRLRLGLNDDGLSRKRANADYLVPNIREFNGSDDKDKSYAFSTNLDDYPTRSLNLITNAVDGFYQPQDYFYRFNHSKVYTVSSFQGAHFKGNVLEKISKDRFLGIKEIAPKEEEDCGGSAVTPPTNFAFKNYTFSLLIADALLLFESIFNIIISYFSNTIVKFFHGIANIFDRKPVRFLSRPFRKGAYGIQNSLQKEFNLINYPECEECSGDEAGSLPSGGTINYCPVGELQVSGDTTTGTRELIASSAGSGVTFGTGITIISGRTGNCSNADITGSTIYEKIDYFVNNQSNYTIDVNGLSVQCGNTGPDDYGVNFNVNFEPNLGSATGYTMTVDDPNEIFNDAVEYTGITIYDLNEEDASKPKPSQQHVESGCDLYDEPYDEGLIVEFYTGGTNFSTNVCDRIGSGSRPTGSIVATRISNNGTPLASSYRGESYNPKTCSGYSEFTNGVFQFIPGTHNFSSISKMLREYRRRKRVGVLFCGGIVNYSFIDNWLSGSLYFFQFKSKIRWDDEADLDLNVANSNYCKDIVHYKVKENGTNSAVKKFYYRSAPYKDSLDPTWGEKTSNGYTKLYHPTTCVDLGPRDEFISNICTDLSIDGNCSVTRSIGPTSFQSFGELFGLAINYKMDVEDGDFSVKEFFFNNGFEKVGIRNEVLSGDILQLISINNETGVEEFDLQNPKYAAYSYANLDPETYPQVFQDIYGNWGPLPVTLEIDDNGGEDLRLCLNEPGKLTESSQNVPFFLWDKGGSGFGPGGSGKDEQAWNYGKVEVQPLQGMSGDTTYTYSQYSLPPMTYDFDGLTKSDAINPLSGTSLSFDIIYTGATSNGHLKYNDQRQGFTYLHVSTMDSNGAPLTGTLYVKYGEVGNVWDTIPWTNEIIFIIKKTKSNYNGNRQILSTPFLFYFGLRPGKTSMDKFIKKFGPKDSFPFDD